MYCAPLRSSLRRGGCADVPQGSLSSPRRARSENSLPRVAQITTDKTGIHLYLHINSKVSMIMYGVCSGPSPAARSVGN